MTVFVNGKKIGRIFTQGQEIREAYSSGQLVFTRMQGWRMGDDFTMVLAASTNASISGTVTFNSFHYYEEGVETDNYYQIALTNLSRPTDGVVELNLGSGTVIYFGNAIHNYAYQLPSNGIIRLSAAEIPHIYRIKASTGLLQLGRRQTFTTYYLEPVWNMALTRLGTTNIMVNAGWSICANRTSRISLAADKSYDMATLGIPSEGTWPLYAVGESATEGVMSSLTCSPTVHAQYQGKCIRHLGFVTAAEGAITAVQSMAQSTGDSFVATISGNVMNTTAGAGTDSDNLKVKVPATSYNYQELIDLANDHMTEGERQIAKTDNVTVMPDGGVYLDNVETAQGDITSGPSGNVVMQGFNILGPCRISAAYRYQGMNYTSRTGWTVYANNEVMGTAPNNQDLDWTTDDTKTITRITWGYTVKQEGSRYVLVDDNTRWGEGYAVQYWPRTFTAGTKQAKAIYAKVTRNQNNSNVDVEVLTESGDSTPFVSYVFLGTINVEKNASTGTITDTPPVISDDPKYEIDVEPNGNGSANDYGQNPGTSTGAGSSNGWIISGSITYPTSDGGTKTQHFNTGKRPTVTAQATHNDDAVAAGVTDDADVYNNEGVTSKLAEDQGFYNRWPIGSQYHWRSLSNVTSIEGEEYQAGLSTSVAEALVNYSDFSQADDLQVSVKASISGVGVPSEATPIQLTYGESGSSEYSGSVLKDSIDRFVFRTKSTNVIFSGSGYARWKGLGLKILIMGATAVISTLNPWFGLAVSIAFTIYKIKSAQDQKLYLNLYDQKKMWEDMGMEWDDSMDRFMIGEVTDTIYDNPDDYIYQIDLNDGRTWEIGANGDILNTDFDSKYTLSGALKDATTPDIDIPEEILPDDGTS